MFNLSTHLEQDFAETIWGKQLLKQVEEILQDGIIKLEAEKKQLSFDLSVITPFLHENPQENFGFTKRFLCVIIK